MHKRIYLFVILTFISMGIIVPTVFAQKSDYYLFVGTFAPKQKNSLFVYRFNSITEKAVLTSAVSNIENPSFFCLSANGQFLYAVSETYRDGLPGGGYVAAYRFNKKKGELIKLNQVSSKGDAPCYIHLDKTGKWLFVSNYSSGNLAVFPIEQDGSVGEASQVIFHDGHGPYLPQQSAAHIHCSVPSADNRYVLAADLGMDKIFTYDFNDRKGRLEPATPPFVQVKAGSGPRHLLFSKNEKYVYSIQEIGAMITVFKNDHGELSKEQSISTAPVGYKGKKWASELQLSPDGRYLYASNRDDLNDIVFYTINRVTGRLRFQARYATGGKTLRYFMITPDGRSVLIGQRNGNSILIYKRNINNGKLAPTNEAIPVSDAVCMVVIPFQK